VQLLSPQVEPADVVAIGSHCVGLDYLLGELEQRGFTTKMMSVGSMGGLTAAKRGECDIAGIHLLDEESDEYNQAFLSPGLELLTGYGRMQGIVFRPGDANFEDQSKEEVLQFLVADDECQMINRNAGSGTRILIDHLLDGKQPAGYAVQAKSHNGVAAAVSQGRADWGLAIETVATMYGLSFLPIREERYDFLIPSDRMNRPGVRALRALLEDAEIREELSRRGFRP
jgi:putative molybdopterin biosynthesis protein